jgi:branched-chain amino acid transport system substrate-binding protein
LTGPGAWFGAEIKQGIDLLVAEIDPRSRTTPGPGEGIGAAGPAPPAAGNARDKDDPASRPAGPETQGESAPGPTSPPATKRRSGPPPEPIEPPDRVRTVSITFQAIDVQPLDLQAAETGVNRLIAAGATAIVTASPTPTLAAYPIAAGRDVIVLHAGLATDRFPAASRMLLQLRPSIGARADTLAAFAWERGIRRLALLAGGDGFGRAVRTATATRWRQLGGHLAHEESLSLDASDRRSRLRSIARVAPEAVVLGFHGPALAEAATALREVGFTGRLLAVDDDRAALLAGADALEGALILSDAFVPVPGTRGARFARAYEARFEQPPSRFAASAYETASLLVEGVQLAARSGSNLSGSRLRDALVAGRSFPSLYAGNLVVRDDGTFARPLTLFRVESGQLSFDAYVGGDGHALPAPPASGALPLRPGFALVLTPPGEAPAGP